MATISTLTVDLLLRANSFNNSIKAAQREAKEFGKRLAPTTTLLKDVGGAATSAGKKLSVGLALPIIGAGVAALKFSTDFNASMANVATLIPGNTERVKELKKSVQDMAIETGKSTGDLADGLFQVVSAFGDSAESADMLRINAKAAAAGMATTTDAINLTSAVTKGYGDVSAAAVQKAADLAFKTNELGQTTFPELAASMGRVIPFAAKLNVSQEELFAGFASLTGVTGNASEVSTQLAAVLKAMLKPTADMSAAMGKLGFESSEAMLQQLGMKGALDALIGSTDGSVESVGKLFGRAEALNAVFALTGGSSDKFADSLVAMANAAGSADTAFKEISEGVNAAGFLFDQFKQRVIVAAQNTGDALVPALNVAFKALEPLIGVIERTSLAFAEMSPNGQLAVVALAAVAASAGPVLFVFGQLIQSTAAMIAIFAKLVPVLKTAAAANTLFGTSLKFLAASGGPILIVTAAVVALGVALWKLRNAFKANDEALDNLQIANDGLAKATEDAANVLRNKYGKEIRRLANESLPDWNKRTTDLLRLQVQLKQALDDAAAAARASGIVHGMLNDIMTETNSGLETMAQMYARVEDEVNTVDELHAAEAELLQATVDKVGEFGRANAAVSAETIGFLTTRNKTHEQVISDLNQREAAFMTGFIQRLEDGSKAEVGEYAVRMIARTKAEKDFRVGLAADELRDIAARNTAAEAEYQKRFDSVKKTFKDVMLAGMRGDWEGFVKDIGSRIIGYFRDTVFVELLSDFGARFLTPLINDVQGALSGIFVGGASFASSAVGRGPATSFPGGGGLPGGGGGGVGGASSLASGFIGAAGGIVGGIIGGLMDRKANGIISGGIDHIKNLLIHHLPDIEKELDFLPEIKDRLNDINDSAKRMVSLLRGLPTSTNIGPEVATAIVEDLPTTPGSLNLGEHILSRSGQDTTRSRLEKIFGGPSSRQLFNRIFRRGEADDVIDRSEGTVFASLFGGGPPHGGETRVVIELDSRVIAEALTNQVKNGGVELVASGTLA